VRLCVTTYIKDMDLIIDNNSKLLQLPMSRVKKIIKVDPDVKQTSSEALFLITKATASTYLHTYLLYFLISKLVIAIY